MKIIVTYAMTASVKTKDINKIWKISLENQHMKNYFMVKAIRLKYCLQKALTHIEQADSLLNLFDVSESNQADRISG